MVVILSFFDISNRAAKKDPLIVWLKPCMFCEESLGKINKCDLELFQNRSVHEFYHLKELITLEQVNFSD